MNRNATLFVLLGVLMISSVTMAQPLTGTKYIGGTNTGSNWYASFTTAVAALNTNGVGAGGVTFNVRPGTYAGRFIINTITGSSANNRTVFQKDATVAGAVTIADSATAAGAADYLVELNGADYITIDSVDVRDIATQTNNMIEYGYYLKEATTTNGCQYVTIKDCRITLNISNTNNTYGIYQNNTSGNATLGTNSYNKYLNLKISKCDVGIYLANGSTPADTLNEIGSTSQDPNFAGRFTVGALANDTIGYGGVVEYGIHGTNQAHLNIHDCDVQHVYVNGRTQATYGIYLLGNDTCSIDGNRIHDIKNTYGTTATGVVYGIYVVGNVASFRSYIYNNQIWGLDHSRTTASATIRIEGIAVNQGTNFVTDNSILMNPTNNNVSNACLVQMTGTLTNENNIFYNKTIGQSGTSHYGIYVSSGTLSTTDYNVFYNTDTLNGRVGYLATSYKFLTDWQAGVRDLHSYEANPFYSSDVNPVNLQIQTSSGSPVSNSGTPITWVSTDLKGTARDAAHPDIGSDEGSFGGPLPAPTTVTFGALTTTSITVNWTAVAGAAAYRLESSTDGSSFSLLSSPVVGTTYNHTGLPNGNTQRYYRVYSLTTENILSLSPSPVKSAYSLANTPATPSTANVTSTTVQVTPHNSVTPTNFDSTHYAIQVGTRYVQTNGTLGAVEAWQKLTEWGTVTVTGLAQGTTYPISTKAINGSGTQTAFSTAASITTTTIPLSGAYTIDRTQLTGGTNYQTFTAAMTALNAQGISGPVTFTVASNTYADTSTTASMIESFPLFLSRTGTSANPIIFKKAVGGTVTVSAGASTDNSIVRLYGCDYVTFDGIDLTVRANTLRYGYYFRDDGTTTNGAQHNTIKNCAITMDRTGTSVRAVYFASVTGTPTTAAGANSYNLLDNLTIHNCQIGIYLTCNVGTWRDSMNVVQNCHIGVGVANDLTIAGIYTNGDASLTVSNNVVANVTNTATGVAAALGDLDAYGIRANNLTGTSLIERNLVSNISQNGAANTPHSALGIYLFPTSGLVNVYNNMVDSLSKTQTTNVQSFTHTSTSNPGYGVFGIYIIGTATASHVYNNSVSLNTTTFLSSAANYFAAGTVVYKNNVFANTTAAQATGKHYGFYTANYAGTPTIDYDCIYFSNANGFVGAYFETDNTWAQWQGHAFDTHGLNANPLFVSGTDLHIQPASGSPVSNAATPGLVTNDYDGTLRSATAPDIGADEGLFAAVLAAPATVTLSAVTTTSITVGWSAVAGAISYKLQSSTDGSVYSDLTNTVLLTYTENSLLGNTSRYYRAYSINADTVLSGSPTVNNTYTVANTPGTPTVSNPTATTFLVTPVNASSPVNTATTVYAIQVESQYVQANGTLGASAVWQTLTAWGTDTVTGLNPSTTYHVSVKARNGSNSETPFSPTATIVTLALALPPAPTGGMIDNDYATSLRINWTAPSPVGTLNSYEIQVSTANAANGFSVLATNLALSPTNYVYVGLPPFTNFWFRIFSKNAQGALSSTYEAVHATTKPNWHSYTTLTGGPGDTTAWNPVFPNDSLTANEPAASIIFAALSHPFTNPTAIATRWDSRANAISLWGVYQPTLDAVLPVSQSVNRIWDINPTGGNNFNATLQLRFKASDLPLGISNPVTQIVRAGYKHGPQNWAYLPCTVSGPDVNGVYTATVNNINQFSYWVLGTSNAELPVSLTSFSASNDDQGVVLDWHVETEVNLDHYRIDRWREGGAIERQFTVASQSINGFSATPFDYTWRERDALQSGFTYYYQLSEIDQDGTTHTLSTTTVVPLPTGLNVVSAYPNPFNPTTTISFALATPEKARVSVYNVNGELVKDLYYGQAGAERRTVTFNASRLPSGVYYLRITSAHYNGTKKLVLMK